MEAFDTYLKQFPNYKPEVFEALEPYLSVKNLDPNDYLLHQGMVCKSIYFIDQGLVRLFYLNDGKEVTNCFCKEGELTASYRSMITKSESDISIQAIEPCRLFALSYENLLTLYDKDPFWQQLGRIAAESEFVRTECHNRFLTDMTATERYLDVLKNDKYMLQRVPLNFLATYLQITPETLSRIRKKISRT